VDNAPPPLHFNRLSGAIRQAREQVVTDLGLTGNENGHACVPLKIDAGMFKPIVGQNLTQQRKTHDM
jgi:hypothetical protein